MNAAESMLLPHGWVLPVHLAADRPRRLDQPEDEDPVSSCPHFNSQGASVAGDDGDSAGIFFNM